MPGYDYTYVDKTLERYMCAICLEVMKDAVETACGHCYCHQCLDDTLRSSVQSETDSVCPVCRSAVVSASVHPLVRLRREINNLKVYCPHKNKGCSHITTVQHMEEHSAHCQADRWYMTEGIPPYMTVPLRRNHEVVSSSRQQDTRPKEPSAPYIGFLDEDHTVPLSGSVGHVTTPQATPISTDTAPDHSNSTSSGCPYDVSWARLLLAFAILLIGFFVFFTVIQSLMR